MTGVKNPSEEIGTLQLKLSSPPHSLSIMNTRNTIRATWRSRFLEIARRYDATGEGSAAIVLPGLRRRGRMAGFATLRRSRAGLAG